MKNDLSPISNALSADSPVSGAAFDLQVNITATLGAVEIMYDGQKMTIMRNQNQNNTINSDFVITSRKCPPFCIQPMELAPGVKTVAELEVLHFLKTIADGDTSMMVIDSRTPDWVTKGFIPGSVNIAWDKFNISKSTLAAVQAIFENQLGAKQQDGFWHFDAVKTLVLFCNGSWCGQSATAINALLKMGYPAHKLFWYRGGMQDWESLGLTTLKPSRRE